ncbi:hypothetical protein F5B22DRAFT_626438 [Xylaria bambusicola]|uniref:uncharacterized protein n=1 Tax=Xylaria bambusicola TaxID=326684 RepID=UPI002007F1A1|nr:uncharacterized protein F5B22DRAFT_626438 [Xylaria bambusicola]KAI0505817.1 hypothetical protein F5B22DRAFT_626438 [Xylaria bambusicola]
MMTPAKKPTTTGLHLLALGKPFVLGPKNTAEGYNAELQVFGCLGALSQALEALGSLNYGVELTLLRPDDPKANNKRRRTARENGGLEASDQHQQTKEASHIIQTANPNACANCGEIDHKAAFCVTVGKSGWMEACCKCDSQEHAYESCPRRQQDEDFTYLILNRGNIGPVKSSLHLGQVILMELHRPDSLYVDTDIVALPHSAAFSMQVGQWRNKDETGYAIELARHGQSLGRAIHTLKDHHWTTQEEHKVDENVTCENCGQIYHSVYEYLALCGFCGSDKHVTMFCEDRARVCLCSKYPKHSRDCCKNECWYCAAVQANHNPHYISECPIICHICLEPGHKTKNCKIKRLSRACRRCSMEEYHYPLVHNICPGAGCMRILATQPCEDHCHICG